MLIFNCTTNNYEGTEQLYCIWSEFLREREEKYDAWRGNSKKKVVLQSWACIKKAVVVVFCYYCFLNVMDTITVDRRGSNFASASKVEGIALQSFALSLKFIRSSVK